MDNPFNDLKPQEGEEDCKYDCVCPGCIGADVQDGDQDALSKSDEESEPREPLQCTQTCAFQAALEGQDIASKVLKILKAIRKEGINLAIFLNALSWGHPECHSNAKIQFV